MSPDDKPDLMPDPPGGPDVDERGEVSQVQNFADAGEPVSDSQSVSGQPTDDAEGTQEGSAGPNSVPPENAERTGIDHRGKAAPEGSSREDPDTGAHPRG